MHWPNPSKRAVMPGSNWWHPAIAPLLPTTAPLRRPAQGLLVWAALLSLWLALPWAPALALSAADLPATPPASHVSDGADLLSRAARNDVGTVLAGLADQQIEATWVSIPRLDYGTSVTTVAQELANRWQSEGSDQLVLVIDGQTGATAIAASSALQDRLSPELLKSTARTTMAQPIREGNRYRQASLDALERLTTVLAGEEDPGEPIMAATASVATARVPSTEETRDSNAFTWVVVLLVVGSVVPMLTWWVFSR